MIPFYANNVIFEEHCARHTLEDALMKFKCWNLLASFNFKSYLCGIFSGFSTLLGEPICTYAENFANLAMFPGFKIIQDLKFWQKLDPDPSRLSSSRLKAGPESFSQNLDSWVLENWKKSRSRQSESWRVQRQNLWGYAEERHWLSGELPYMDQSLQSRQNWQETNKSTNKILMRMFGFDSFFKLAFLSFSCFVGFQKPTKKHVFFCFFLAWMLSTNTSETFYCLPLVRKWPHQKEEKATGLLQLLMESHERSLKPSKCAPCDVNTW